MKSAPYRWLAALVLASAVAVAQQSSSAVGAVEATDPASGQITLKTDAGASLKITPQSGARFVKIPPGEKSLAKGTPITAADIQVGDRLLARGQFSDDKASVAATLLVVMTKGDLAKKHAADAAEWQKRGVGGIVTNVDPDAHTVTITTRTAEGIKPVTIVTSASTQIRRWAPDSVKFADAKPSSLGEIKPGDQVRALGERHEGAAGSAEYEAEEMVSGKFRNVAATVIGIDAAAQTLRVTDLTTKKPLLIHINSDSMMRKMPEMMARGIAMRLNGGGAAGAGGPGGAAPAGGAAGGGAAPGGGNGRGAQGGAGAGGGQGGPSGGGGMRARSGDLQHMIENMPAVKLEDLKPGDALIISSTEGADPGQVTAITLVAGVEPILSAAPGGSQRASMLGSWNLDMNMGGMQ